MAKSALNELQQQVEAVRREAFAAGYTAAMTSIHEFAGRPAAGTEVRSATRRKRPAVAETRRSPPRRAQRAAAGMTRRTRRAPAQRLQRGTNARLVEEILQANAPTALRPAQIRVALQNDKGVAVSFPSISQALYQLRARNSVEQSDDGRSWRSRASQAA